MRELVVVEADRVGLLADVSEALGKKGVNIESVSADAVAGKAVVRVLVSDAKKGERALRAAGFRTVSSDTVVVELSDRPGRLSTAARILSDAGVNLLNVYYLGKEKGKALVAFKVKPKDNLKARRLLKDYF
ncbi:MAG: ACT domain-containing protein [Candidatus ainarchaeum sp.]|nr:ACT domain-containing protein [Candidatus ainarchaeum sp.]